MKEKEGYEIKCGKGRENGEGGRKWEKKTNKTKKIFSISVHHLLERGAV
jgi:hypothetical protein